MKYGLHLPNFGAFGDARVLAGLASDAERSGWDGFFLWDHLLFCDLDQNDHVDPWVALTAVAAATDSILLGPLVTPLPRRRPWELARQTVSLQNYSGGRLVLGAGIGAPAEWDFRFFGDPTDEATRGRMLDEGLEILTGLWGGTEFGFTGEHYSIEPMTFLPAPVKPIPVWVGGSWPNRPPFRRAARFDGMVPMTGGASTPEALREAVDFVATQREDASAPFDVVVGGVSDAAASGHPSIAFDSLATWWLED